MTQRWCDIPKQTKLVENGEIGDCWRCCIAAVLDIPAAEVPHFLQGVDGINHNVDPDTQEWLNDRGYVIAYACCYGGSREGMHFPRWSHSELQLPPLISCGPTERSRGLGRHHAVVTVGGEVVYDPHPSEAGLTAVVEQWLIFQPVYRPDGTVCGTRKVKEAE